MLASEVKDTQRFNAVGSFNNEKAVVSTFNNKKGLVQVPLLNIKYCVDECCIDVKIESSSGAAWRYHTTTADYE